MSSFKETWEEVIDARKKYEKECQDDFLCELLQYFMTLDYKALVLDAIKDGYYAYEIANHPKLCFLSESQKDICYKVIFKTLKKQHLLDENLIFDNWYNDTGNTGITDTLYIVRLHIGRHPSASWMININSAHRMKNEKGLCMSYSTDLYKLLPQGDHFISGHTYKSQN